MATTTGHTTRPSSECGVWQLRYVRWGGKHKHGVYGYATGGAYAFGVYGMADSATNANYAGYFAGDVRVTGTLMLLRARVGTWQPLRSQ